jgi:methionyl aminopeptidase
MFTLSGRHEVRIRDDGWTVITADGSLAAHWENTIAVTEAGPRILTASAKAAEALPSR